MVAAFADLNIGVMPGRQFDAGNTEGIGHQILKWIMRLRQSRMNSIHHLLGRLWTCDGKYARVHLPYQVPTAITPDGTKASRHDHLAVLRHGEADGSERFRFRTVKKTAGVDDHRIGPDMAFRQLIAFRPQLRDDPLAVHQSLGAAERDKRNGGGLCGHNNSGGRRF